MNLETNNLLKRYNILENGSFKDFFKFRMTDKMGKSARFTDDMNKVLIEAYGKH